MDRTSHVGTYNILYRFKSNACVENEFDGLNNNNNEKETTLSISLRCKNLKTTIYVFRMESGLQYRGGFTTMRTYTRRHEFIARLENRERVASTSTYVGYPSGTSYIHTYIMYSYNIYIIINSVCCVCTSTALFCFGAATTQTNGLNKRHSLYISWPRYSGV